jgi:hypothetical protein
LLQARLLRIGCVELGADDMPAGVKGSGG